MKMKETGLHDKFPAGAKLLADFKKHLAQRVPNWQQEVDNVSRFIRYMQPTGDELTLDFLSKTAETQELQTALQRTGMSATTIVNYFKSMLKFLEYLLTRVDLHTADPQLQSSCNNYQQLLTNLRKTVLKSPADTRDGSSIGEAASIAECQKILREAEPDFIRIRDNLLKDLQLSSSDKTVFRYYCEALLVYRHMQRPGAVEGLTDAEWVKRSHHGDRIFMETSGMRVALTQDEEALFQMYYTKIRPGCIRLGKAYSGFFLSSSGEAVHSVSKDMSRFHEMYKLPTAKYVDVRKAVEGAARNLNVDQQEAIRSYMASSAGDLLQPLKIVDTAVLLDSLVSSSTDEEQSTSGTSTGQHTSEKDFSAFVDRFPVSLEGQPPSKKQRVDAGFPEETVFYHKWRAAQYARRVDYLLSHFTMRRPTTATVARLIAKEGWKANYPKPEEIERLWKPSPKGSIETDTFLHKCVSEQVWPGLAIKDFGAPQGFGVVATRPFSKGEIVCDYHGKLITAAEGKAMMESLHDEAGYMFFFKAGQRDLCIDAQTFPCECHPAVNTIGRRINHSSKMPNVKPFHCVLKVDGEDRTVILFRALKDITIDTQLKFDYGVNRKSFRGEGESLEWLND